MLYYNTYGKLYAFISSPYLHFSIFISLLSYPAWHQGSNLWYEMTLSILPNILGFTLGGYAILLAFGNDEFLKLIAGRDNDKKGNGNKSDSKYNSNEREHSPYMKLNGAFIHFIFFQGISILFSIIGKSWEIKTGFAAFIGFTLLIYAISTAIAAAIAIFNISEVFDRFVEIKNQINQNNKTKK